MKNIEFGNEKSNNNKIFKKNCKWLREWIFKYGIKDEKEVGCRRIEINNLNEINPFKTFVTDKMIDDFTGDDRSY